MAKKTTTKKITKKSTPKASVKTKTQVQAHAVKESVGANLKTDFSKTQAFKIRKTYVVLVIIMLALGALLYYARGLFVAAVVNGQPVSRLSIVKEAEKQSGRQALEDIVRNTLIEQEAKKQKITVTDQEVSDEIKTAEEAISKQGQKLDDVLVMRGMTRDDFRKLIRLDKLVGKIVGKDVKITDKELDEYVEKNKEVLPQNQSAEQLRKTAESELRQQKLNEKVQVWLESLRNKAKILYFVQY